MENEIMNYEEETMNNEIDVIETEEGTSGVGTLVAMAIGAGLTIATGAVVKFGKKLWEKHKAKKELRLVDEHDFVEVSDEEIEAVTK